MIDLHIHTRCSDGGLTPTEVVEYALGRGLEAVAITDHDCIAGNAEAAAAGAARGLPVVPGIEISTDWGGLTFHLLGYGIRRLTPRVLEALAFLEGSRGQRNPRMVEKLRALGADITLEEVLHEANGSLLGRPHLARVLVKKGAAASIQDAFDRFLGRGAAAYVDKERLTPADACELIRDAGGVAVLAHPVLVELDRPGALPGLLRHLVGLGLEGIEALYSRHTPEQSRRYLGMARDLGLLVTGGSDFHRAGEGGPDMGTGFGSLRVPFHHFESLRSRLAAGD
ncbi:MAG: PHP domain-containing protein [Deferrisomatales bacterium]